MYRRQYTLQQNTNTGWANILSAQQHVSKQHVLGFAKGMRQYNPCPELRMIDHQTGEVLEQWAGKGPVVTNNGSCISLTECTPYVHFKDSIIPDHPHTVEILSADMMKIEAKGECTIIIKFPIQ